MRSLTFREKRLFFTNNDCQLVQIVFVHILKTGIICHEKMRQNCDLILLPVNQDVVHFYK